MFHFTVISKSSVGEFITNVQSVEVFNRKYLQADSKQLRKIVQFAPDQNINVDIRLL